MKLNIQLVAIIIVMHLNTAKGFVPAFSTDVKKESHNSIQVGKTDTVPVIDGKLDDPLWKSCMSAKAFYKMGTDRPAEEQTVVLVARDNSNLYLAAICQDTEMDYLVDVKKKENDAIYLDDSLEFYFSLNIEGPVYQLVVNPRAVIAHWGWRGKTKVDWNVNGIQVKTDKGANGWTVEISIPLSVFALPTNDGVEWRFNVCRNYYTDQDNYNIQYSSWVDLGEGANSYFKPEKFASFIMKSVPATNKPSLPFTENFVKCPVIPTSPKVDGNLDDEVWKNAAKLTNFFDVADLKQAKKQTIAYIARTEDVLYIGVCCEEPVMEYLVAMREHQNNLWADDCIEIFLGSRKDRQTYYNLMINPLGLVLTQKQSLGNNTWSPKFDIAVKKGSDFWAIELSIPFSQIPLTRTDVAWTFNVCRSFYTDDDSYVRNKSSWVKLTPVSLSIYNNNPNSLNFYHQPKNFGMILFKSNP